MTALRPPITGDQRVGRKNMCHHHPHHCHHHQYHCCYNHHQYHCDPYLIFFASGASVIFSGCCNFFTEDAKGTVLNEVYPGGYIQNPHIFVMTIPFTTSQIPNASSHVTLTPSQCHTPTKYAIPIDKYAKQKTQVHESKQQICHTINQAVYRKALFVTNLRNI